MNIDPGTILAEGGAFGILALAFLWLLRSVIANNKALGDIITNHLSALLKQQGEITESLQENTRQMKEVTWEMNQCRRWRGERPSPLNPPPTPPPSPP